jgi:hypothetical protein
MQETNTHTPDRKNPMRSAIHEEDTCAGVRDWARARGAILGGKAGHRQGGGSSKHEAAPAEQRRRAKLDGGHMPPFAMRELF